MSRPSNFVRITSSQLVSSRPVVLTGVLSEVTVDGSFISIYNGQDANSGILFTNYKSWAAENSPAEYPHPVLFDRGLYVVLGTNVTAATLIFETADLDPADMGDNVNIEVHSKQG